MLVTERQGRLRIVRNGVLDPQPIAGVPQVQAGGTSGLLDIALHPKFATNGLVYLTYNKQGMGKKQDGTTGNVYTTALARGRFDGKALVDVKEIFLAQPWTDLAGGDASRFSLHQTGHCSEFFTSPGEGTTGPITTSEKSFV
jgi:glucose/arabinose dehydrogenase